MDRENIIKGLECCITFDKTFECGIGCPYLPTCDAEVKPLDAPKFAGLQLHIDALELLKEQEADIEQLKRFINGFSKDAIVPVRCKDCKKRNQHHECEYGYHSDDWFCADGERKEDR